MIVEWIVAGFFSAIGWWGWNYYVVDRYIDPKPALVQPEKKERNEKTSDPAASTNDDSLRGPR